MKIKNFIVILLYNFILFGIPFSGNTKIGDPVKNLEKNFEIQPTSSACSVEITGISNIECQGEVISYTINFDSQEFGSNGYYLQENDFIRGPYFSPDSINWGYIAYCSEPTMFIIFDADNETCRDTFIWDTYCCPCEIDFQIQDVVCNNGIADVYFSLHITEGSCLAHWEDITFTVNGVAYEFEYLNTNFDFVARGVYSGEQINHYRINSSYPAGTFEEVILENECISTCNISNFVVLDQPSQCDGEFKRLPFEFNSFFFGTQGFSVSTNYGDVYEFDLNDQFYIDIISSCNQEYVFTIMDNLDSDCTATYNFGPVCCECFATYGLIEESPCENGSFDAVHELVYISGSCFTNDWTLKINGNAYPYTWLTNELLRIEDISFPDSLLTFELCHNGSTAECFSFISLNPCYNNNNNCSLTFEELNQPVCESNNIQVQIFIEGQNLSMNGFDVYVNDSLVLFLPFESDSTYDFVLNNPVTENFLLTICDSDNPDCCSERQLPNPCYDPSVDCVIFYDFFGNPACANNKIVTNWFIFGDHISETGYDVFVNDSLVLFLPFNPDNTYTMALPHFGGENIVLNICDHEYQNCCLEWVLGNPCYDPDSNCSIDFEQVADPVCDNGNIHVPVIIVGENLSMSGFDVFLNDNFVLFLPFEADSTYNLVLSDSGDQSFTLSICDSDHPSCCSERQLSNPCFVPDVCSLVFEELQEPVCDSNNIHVPILIDGQNLSMTGFNVYVNDSLTFFLPFESDSTYNLVLSDPGTENFILTICDSDHPDCCSERQLSNPCFVPDDECSLAFEELENPVCDSNYIVVPILIVGQNLSMTGFNVYVNDSLTFFLPFESDSTYNLVLSDPGTENFILTICDSDHPDCCSERQLSNPCFVPDNECSLAFEVLQEPVCGNGNIHVPIIIVGQNLSMTGFDVFVNDSFALFLPFEADSTYNLNLSDPGTENFTIRICDSNNPDCCMESTIVNPCFDLENCWLVELEGKLDVVPPDSLSLVVDYTLGGDCPEVQVATVCLNGVNPVTSEVRNQRYEGVFERVDTDSILVKFCLALTTDTCVYFLVKNPFSTSTHHTANIPFTIQQTAHSIVINNPTSSNYQYQIFDITGKILVTNYSSVLENIISIHDYRSGIYMISVLHGNQRLTKRFFTFH